MGASGDSAGASGASAGCTAGTSSFGGSTQHGSAVAGAGGGGGSVGAAGGATGPVGAGPSAPSVPDGATGGGCTWLRIWCSWWWRYWNLHTPWWLLLLLLLQQLLLLHLHSLPLLHQHILPVLLHLQTMVIRLLLVQQIDDHPTKGFEKNKTLAIKKGDFAPPYFICHRLRPPMASSIRPLATLESCLQWRANSPWHYFYNSLEISHLVRI